MDDRLALIYGLMGCVLMALVGGYLIAVSGHGGDAVQFTGMALPGCLTLLAVTVGFYIARGD